MAAGIVMVTSESPAGSPDSLLARSPGVPSASGPFPSSCAAPFRVAFSGPGAAPFDPARSAPAYPGSRCPFVPVPLTPDGMFGSAAVSAALGSAPPSEFVVVPVSVAVSVVDEPRPVPRSAPAPVPVPGPSPEPPERSSVRPSSAASAVGTAGPSCEPLTCPVDFGNDRGLRLSAGIAPRSGTSPSDFESASETLLPFSATSLSRSARTSTMARVPP